jgi:nicotinamidase-related amidase
MPTDTVLLIIDVQAGLFQHPTPIYKAQELLEKLNLLIENAHQAGAPVVFIQHNNQNHLLKDSPAWQLHPALRPEPHDLHIDKQHGDAFEDTPLGAELEAREIRRVVACGLVTHGCVRATCLGALQRGYGVTLASDAHSNYHKKAGELIEEWNQKLSEAGVRLLTTAEVSFLPAQDPAS